MPVLRYRAVCVWLLATSSALGLGVENNGGIEECPRDQVVLERGSSTEISGLNANASCYNANVVLLGGNSPLPLNVTITNGNQPCAQYPVQYISVPKDVALGDARIFWNCDKGFYCRIMKIADPTTSATVAISTFAISQTCTTEEATVSGTCTTNAASPTGTAPTGTGIVSGLTTGGSPSAPTENSMPTGPGTTQGEEVGSTVSGTDGAGPAGSPTISDSLAPTETAMGPEPTTAGATAEMTSTPAAQTPAPPAESPSGSAGSLDTGSATDPSDMMPSPTDAGRPSASCTCQS